MKERGGLLADQVDAAGVVDVVNVVPADALGPVLLLRKKKKRKKREIQSADTAKGKLNPHSYCIFQTI